MKHAAFITLAISAALFAGHSQAEKLELPDCAIKVDVLPVGYSQLFSLSYEIHPFMSNEITEVVKIEAPPFVRAIAPTVVEDGYDFRIRLQDQRSINYIGGKPAPWGEPERTIVATFEMIRANVDRYPEWARKVPTQPLASCEVWRNGKRQVSTVRLPGSNPATCKLDANLISSSDESIELWGKDNAGKVLVKAGFKLQHPPAVLGTTQKAKRMALEAAVEKRCNLVGRGGSNEPLDRFALVEKARTGDQPARQRHSPAESPPKASSNKGDAAADAVQQAIREAEDAIDEATDQSPQSDPLQLPEMPSGVDAARRREIDREAQQRIQALISAQHKRQAQAAAELTTLGNKEREQRLIKLKKQAVSEAQRLSKQIEQIRREAEAQKRGGS